LKQLPLPEISNLADVRQVVAASGDAGNSERTPLVPRLRQDATVFDATGHVLI
jgi:hypothetical protein